LWAEFVGEFNSSGLPRLFALRLPWSQVATTLDRLSPAAAVNDILAELQSRFRSR